MDEGAKSKKANQLKSELKRTWGRLLYWLMREKMLRVVEKWKWNQKRRGKEKDELSSRRAVARLSKMDVASCLYLLFRGRRSF